MIGEHGRRVGYTVGYNRNTIDAHVLVVPQSDTMYPKYVIRTSNKVYWRNFEESYTVGVVSDDAVMGVSLNDRQFGDRHVVTQCVSVGVEAGGTGTLRGLRCRSNISRISLGSVPAGTVTVPVCVIRLMSTTLHSSLNCVVPPWVYPVLLKPISV